MNKTTTPQHSAVATAELQARIDRLYDHLYANAPVRTPYAIGVEVGKILHAVMYIEESRPTLFSDARRFPAFNFDRSELKRLNRAEEGLCEQVAGLVRGCFAEMNEAWHLYEPGTELLLRDTDIAYVCGQLSGVLISDRSRDVFGDALEIFRGQWAKREGGQFFTDQRVTSLAMTLLDFDPRRGDDLVDLCAGTGGFLLAGLNHIRALLEQGDDRSALETEVIELAARSIWGQEVDPQVCEIANATLASRLSVVDRPFVQLADSLQPCRFKDQAATIRYDSHMCAATNPPFGSKITVKDENLLQHYDLARTGGFSGSFGYTGKLTSRAPEILFIEQNVRILKPSSGRLAIVVPYQVLSGPQTLYVREWLLRHTELLAVVDLPADTFQPHTGTKASLLVVKRRAEPLKDFNDAEDRSVLMSIPRWIGHDRRGNPVYKRNHDGELTGEILSDFGAVAEAFHAYKRGLDPQLAHARSFAVRLSSILRDPSLRMNAQYYKPSSFALQADNRGEGEKVSRRVVRLRDVVKQIFYPTRFKRNYVDCYPGAVPFLGGSNISQLIVTTDKWLRHDDPKLDELRVRAGWLLVTRSGSTGIVSSVPEAWDGYAMSEHIIRVVPDPDKLSPAYLHAFLRTSYAQELLARGIFGSVIDEITPEFIGELEIPLPDSSHLLQEVTAKIERAESARDTAIDALLEGVDRLDAWLKE